MKNAVNFENKLWSNLGKLNKNEISEIVVKLTDNDGKVTNYHITYNGNSFSISYKADEGIKMFNTLYGLHILEFFSEIHYIKDWNVEVK